MRTPEILRQVILSSACAGCVLQADTYGHSEPGGATGTGDSSDDTDTGIDTSGTMGTEDTRETADSGESADTAETGDTDLDTAETGSVSPDLVFDLESQAEAKLIGEAAGETCSGDNYAIGFAGDVDGDGADDVIIGAGCNSRGGRARPLQVWETPTATGTMTCWWPRWARARRTSFGGRTQVR